MCLNDTVTLSDPVYPALQARLARVRLLAMDVDGVLTDGGVIYASGEGELKRFHVADGLGLTALRLMGYSLAWISGRTSPVVARRAAELHIKHLQEGVRDKGRALSELLQAEQIPSEEVAYIGDDWNDLPAFAVAGVRIAVANAVPEVKAAADWITGLAGGQGAVREVCDALLDATNRREQALEAYLNLLAVESASWASMQ